MINRLVLTGSAASVPCLRQTVLNKVDARDSRKEGKWQEEAVKCSEITDRDSSAGQFHNTLL